MLRIAIIIGSTRPGRNGEAVAKWVYEIAQKRNDAQFELVDIKDLNLLLLDEPVPPIMGQYSQQHTKVWSAKIALFDAYVFVTPSTTTGPRARSKMPLISSTTSGSTRRLDLLATAVRQGRARWRICDW
jgi:NAD(P)H-dependent FMN reductase